MARLLHIEASPLKDRSNSTSVAEHFVREYQKHHAADDIVRIDLWRVNLPPFDAETIGAKFAVLRKQEFTPAQWERWNAVRAISRQFNAADKYVFSVPMWNFGVPYPLKHFIDVVTLPGENWTWSKERGYESLLSQKRALLIYSSANIYADAHDSDHLRPYLRRWLRFLGISVSHEIDVAPTLDDREAVAAKRAAAIEKAMQLAAGF
jgi:FMN-dependent NADH-azoreductase